MAFYLKYRPQKIKDLDLASVRDDLTRVLRKESIPHSFLFAGPKGTGKTSAARILAKVVNCEKRAKGAIEPCGTCKRCVEISEGKSIDVIEMDAASHRGIDDIRALRDAVKLSPAHAKRKVYIIDEAHMLTTEASNALLKTLEEPPEHVIFVLATTNPEKLIPTIRSRTTLIQFTKATIDEIVSSLEKKLKGENLQADKEALEMIAEESDGSFRDADKLLEQLVQKGERLTKERVKEKLFGSGSFDSAKLVQALADKDSVLGLRIVADAIESGVATELLLDSTIKMLRKALLALVGVGDFKNETNLDKEEITRLIHLLIRAKSEINDAPMEQIPLELAIVEWCENLEFTPNGGDGDSNKTSLSQSNGTVNGKSNGESKKLNSTLHGNEPVLEELKSGKNAEPYVLGDGEPVSPDLWAKVLSGIRPINASTEALLRASRPLEMTGNKLKLGVYYQFHKEHLESINHKSLLEQVCTEVFGVDTYVECLLTEPPAKSSEPERSAEVVVQQTTTSSADQLPPQSENTQQAGSAVLSREEDEQIMKMAKEIFGE